MPTINLRGAQKNYGVNAANAVSDLDLEIRQVTGSRWTLDHVVRDLIDTGKPVTFARLTKAAEGRIGRPSRVLAAVAPR